MIEARYLWEVSLFGWRFQVATVDRAGARLLAVLSHALDAEGRFREQSITNPEPDTIKYVGVAYVEAG